MGSRVPQLDTSANKVEPKPRRFNWIRFLNFKLPSIKRPSPDNVSDEQFIRDLKQLKDLRSFLIREAVGVAWSPDTFEGLDRLRYHPLGRTPTEAEYGKVQDITRGLFGFLPDSLRRKFVLGRIPWWVAWLPVVLALLAIVFLVGAQLVLRQEMEFASLEIAASRIFPFYIGWLASLGAMGALAFIGMNALSVQDDVTFDLMNTRLMFLRITLGSLFGLILALPFAIDDFVKFLANTIVIRREANPDIMRQAVMMVSPFILGFSTSLVILILNRFVDGVQGFFGRSTAGAPSKSRSNLNASRGSRVASNTSGRGTGRNKTER
jgi:hypothetical protein